MRAHVRVRGRSSGGDLGGLASTFLQKLSVPALVEAVRAAVPVAKRQTRCRRPRRLGITCLVQTTTDRARLGPRFLETGGIDVVGRSARGDEALAAIELRPAIALLGVSMEPVKDRGPAPRRAGRFGDRRHPYTLTTVTRTFPAGAGRGRPWVRAQGGAARADAGHGGGGRRHCRRRVQCWRRRAARASPLTGRERQGLALVADGMTNGAAAAELGISHETVQSHVRNAMAKLEADTRTQAVATALRQQLIA